MGLRVRENNTMIGSYHSHSQTALKKLKNEIAYTPDLKVVGMTMVLMKLLIILLIEKRMENMKNLKNHSTQVSIELYMHLDQKGW